MKKLAFTLEYRRSPSLFTAEYPEDTENLAENRKCRKKSCLEELLLPDQRIENLRTIPTISQLATVVKDLLWFLIFCQDYFPIYENGDTEKNQIDNVGNEQC